ncbi:unnamed protein product, partial [Vitis vinifera]|uniref:Uncharacterized protein n=1 Tax=Vitis vinifera TaxID=29760 RepID=D7TYS5_VITVI
MVAIKGKLNAASSRVVGNKKKNLKSCTFYITRKLLVLHGCKQRIKKDENKGCKYFALITLLWHYVEHIIGCKQYQREGRRGEDVMLLHAQIYVPLSYLCSSFER